MARRRSRGGGPSKGKGLLLIGLVVLLVMGTAPPVLSFDSATVERQSSINVTNDGDAIVGLVTTDVLTAGTEGPLVNTTNAVGSDVTVTLTLQNQSKGTLTNGTVRGDILKFGLTTGETENVSIELNCEASVDDRIEYRTEVTDPGFRGDLNRSATVTDSVCDRRELVFLETSGLASVTNTDTVSKYDTQSVDYIGPKKVDFDDDGRNEIPFSEDGHVKLADQDGIKNLTKSAKSGENNNLNLWAGRFNGTEPAVYFTQQNNITRVNSSENVTEVYASGNTDIVGGVGDVDPTQDGDELVLSRGGELGYKPVSGSFEKSTSSFSPGDQDSLGQPADFNDNGVARVPIVDGSGDLRLVNLRKGEASDKLEDNSNALKKSPIASLDYDTDGLPEVVYVSDSGKIKYIDGLENSSTGNVKNVTDGNGDPVEVSDTTAGVA